MLFNSHVFIFVFLPALFFGFVALRKMHAQRLACWWLVAGSGFFLAWWNPRDLAVLAGSIVFNYAVSTRLLAARRRRSARLLAVTAVLGNLSLLGYYKYAGFFLNVGRALQGEPAQASELVLPLAISFYTFQQITYIVDCYIGRGAAYSFADYCLYVMFFPHLIAGPITHHADMMPQFAAARGAGHGMIARGISLFVLGLSKKVLLADPIAAYASPVFRAAQAGADVGFVDAWIGSLAYTFQLYFDFSGYSDMAVGAGMLFGIVFPLNFNSPYRAASIIDFWRRWHISLSTFLRDYVYIPLGGSRCGPVRRYANLVLTMLIGGFWHGAGWTFIAWGGLHGLLLLVNHAWIGLVRRTRLAGIAGSAPYRAGARVLTFGCVVFGWVLFRAESFDAAMRLWCGLAGLNGLGLAERYAQKLLALGFPADAFASAGGSPVLTPSLGSCAALVALLAVVQWAPNSQEIVGVAGPRGRPKLAPGAESTAPAWWRWRPSVGWATLIAILAVTAVAHITKLSEFLYFQF
jgi:D-alanyl-lipoteichoic acid acyltransferase DltB (MBOAT superfamily)